MTYDFPNELLSAQRDLNQVRADLTALYKQLPYSVEPLEGGQRPEGYPDSPGWSEQEQTEVAALRRRERELSAVIDARLLRWQGRSVQTPAASSSTPSRSRPLRGAKGRRSSRAAHQPARLALLATTINCAIAALIRDAGTPTVEDRVRALRSELDVAGLTSMTPTLELAHAFHQAVLDDREALTDTIARLRAQTRDGTYAYYTDIVHFMAGLPLPADHPAPHWLDGEVATRARWHDLVTTRRDLLHERR